VIISLNLQGFRNLAGGYYTTSKKHLKHSLSPDCSGILPTAGRQIERKAGTGLIKCASVVLLIKN